MVHRVTAKNSPIQGLSPRSVVAAATGSNIPALLFQVCTQLPWERLITMKSHREAREFRSNNPGKQVLVNARGQIVGVPDKTPPSVPVPLSEAKLEPKPSDLPEFPGCFVADETGVALFHIEGLARGNGGFGVLRQTAQHLQNASDVAQKLSRSDISTQLLEISWQLSEVKTSQDAAEVAAQLRPVADQCWKLGQVCGIARSSHG